MSNLGCLGHMQEILAAMREGTEPPPEEVPEGEVRGVALKTDSALKDGKQHQVWRLRCTECAWFDCQWTRAEVKASYAEHLTTHGAAA